ncbi:MAG: tRNA pseudouridine(38-40) synthase TruA [Balneolales bacterium]|nr:tRNA pseudouridine(38-40) synthase TruA [Balneolales bacterium]
MRYLLHISYNGTRYNGWQIQPNGDTIQERIEHALQVILQTKVSVTGSGRTDAGVHALGQAAHFDVENSIADLNRFCRSLNGLLPNDIVVTSAEQTSDNFHARFDANYRTYHYYFSQQPQALYNEFTSHWYHSFDIGLMREAADMILGDLDCRTFTPFDKSLPHHRCFFFDSEITGPDDSMRFTFKITANRFLRSVVRSLSGTLYEVGRGKISPQQFKNLFVNPDRNRAGSTASPAGLVLYRVGYDERWKLPSTDHS